MSILLQTCGEQKYGTFTSTYSLYFSTNRLLSKESNLFGALDQTTAGIKMQWFDPGLHNVDEISTLSYQLLELCA